MKKSLLALAVAAALPAVAQAQSSVTLYGIVDGAVEYVNKAAASPTTAGAGAKGGLRLTDGGPSNPWSNSRFGIRGNEPLGNTGMSAIFNIEHRFSIDTGVSGGEGAIGTTNGLRVWNGLASVGLKGSFGEITVGRQYTPGFYAWLASDFAGNSGYHNWALVGHPDTGTALVPSVGGSTSNASYGVVRSDNSVMLANTIGALNYRLMYGFGENAIATATNPTGDFYGLSAGFAVNKQISLNGFYHNQKTNVAASMDNSYGVSVKWDGGTSGVTLGYSKLERVDNRDFDTIVVSAYVNAAGGKIILNGQQVSSSTNNDVLSIGATYQRPLSNRTALYFAVAQSDQTDNARGKQTRGAVGVQHRF